MTSPRQWSSVGFSAPGRVEKGKEMEANIAVLGDSQGKRLDLHTLSWVMLGLLGD